MCVVCLPIHVAAAELAFARADDSDISQAIAKQFVSSMSAAAEADFSWARADVDADTYDELFIRLEADGMCIALDCPIVGYRKDADGVWRAILTAVGQAVRSSGVDLEVSTGNGWQTYESQAGVFVRSN